MLGDTLLGDTLLGDTILGDPRLGDTLLGDTLLGDPMLVLDGHSAISGALERAENESVSQTPELRKQIEETDHQLLPAAQDLPLQDYFEQLLSSKLSGRNVVFGREWLRQEVNHSPSPCGILTACGRL